MSGGVRIEDEDDLVGVPRQQPRVFNRQRGAQRRHRVGESGLVHRDHIHISLAQDQPALLGGFGEVEREQLVCLFEHRRVGGVEILGLGIVQYPPAERDHIAAHIDDGDDDAFAENIEQPSVFLAALRQKSGLQLFVAKSLLAQRVNQKVKSAGRPSQPEVANGAVGVAAAVVIIQRLLAFGGVERLVIQSRGFPVGFQHTGAQPRRSVVLRRVRQPHAYPPRQQLHRVHIVQVFDLLNKGDGVAAHPATEAVKRIVFGIQRERRRFFAVERAQPDQVAPPPF